ncbi:SMP-30/gluconolactonase/LRE family protein [Variovorax sp. LG9.2]|jgi:gluconolactonase|uniref:SMP-30/gluconolactonase/LRE family protein n=1 Tax=Variovorax sp. LG9.2 TaxID=3048626 RepID=UPI002B223968|nr:SMP-30/gluconolactonase/LRE family protein [Variovorax sp. LG9.2]MEB0055717.1 SMP-30/gluconolactonase/LRE family protein [Variovorax sp. LG9.2]
MTRFTVLAEGLAFPEGPVVLPDGDIIVTEIGTGALTCITRNGAVRRVAETGGGPNGAALGRDGALYVCNNGGFNWDRTNNGWRPLGRAADNDGGRIERVDLVTGHVERLYTQCDGHPLTAPNDLVVDAHGGLWFTDHGHREGRRMDIGVVFYARCDGSFITQVAFPLISPNGIGLSPDGGTLYVAETSSGRLWSWPVVSPGVLGRADWPSPTGGNLVCGLPGFQRYDSLAVEACGNIAIATLRFGGIVVVSPVGELVERITLPDPYSTNICFGGDAMQTAYVTLSGTGRLVSMPWARAGLVLEA